MRAPSDKHRRPWMRIKEPPWDPLTAAHSPQGERARRRMAQRRLYHAVRRQITPAAAPPASARSAAGQGEAAQAGFSCGGASRRRPCARQCAVVPTSERTVVRASRSRRTSLRPSVAPRSGSQIRRPVEQRSAAPHTPMGWPWASAAMACTAARGGARVAGLAASPRGWSRPPAALSE